MRSVERSRTTRFVDALWRVVLWSGFRAARVWWSITRPAHQGALVAIYVGGALLLLKSSYRNEWGLPGGSIHEGETPEVAARREMDEEIGFVSQQSPLIPAGSVTGLWDGRHDTVHFFELHLDRLPELRLDYREIVGTRLASPDEVRTLALTAPVALYVARRQA